MRTCARAETKTENGSNNLSIVMQLLNSEGEKKPTFDTPASE